MAEATFSLDLHVLGPPLTFALSQDQTLHRKFEPALRCALVWEASGGRPPRATWNGFGSIQTRNLQSIKRLAIQFSETDPIEESLTIVGGSSLGSTRSSRECAYKGCRLSCQR